MTDRMRWLLNRSRRKARRSQARERYLRVQAFMAWMAVEGVELAPWKRRILANSLRQVDHG